MGGHEDDEESELQPAPELLAKFRELVSSDNQEYTCASDLKKYLKRQPPTSEDAVAVADLIIEMRKNIRGRLDHKSEEYEGCACDCPLHMGHVIHWYELAIQLNPNNSTPYERLAREIWWEEDQWPGTTLEPLRRDYDKATLKRVMEQYQREDSELVKMLGGTVSV